MESIKRVNNFRSLILVIAVISIFSLIALSFLSDKKTVEETSPVTIDSIQQEELPVQETPTIKVETPLVPVKTLKNNQTTLPPNVTQSNPVTVNITSPTPTVIIQSPVTEEESPMVSTAPTYTIKKEGEVIKSSILLEEVRTFVSDLNNYLTWRKKVKTASVEELTEMLSANQYELTLDK